MHYTRRIHGILPLSLLWLLFSVTGYAQAYHDSTIYHDSVLTRLTLSPHQPLSMTFAAGASFHSFTDNSTLMPPPLSGGCDTFTIGNGSTPYFEAGIELPLSDGLSIHPSLSYRSFGGDHTFQQFLPGADTLTGGRTIRDVEFNHVITTYTKGIGIDALLQWRPIAGLQFEAGPGFYYLFDKRYQKVISAANPGDQIHDAGGNLVRSYTESSGDQPDARSFIVAAVLRLGYEVPFSSVLFAMPNISAVLPLSGVTGYTTLRTLQAGIGFRYEFPAAVDTIRDVYHELVPFHIRVRDAEPPKRFEVGIDASAIDAVGNRTKIATLEVQEVMARNAFPLLNYIFFDSASSVIASRYVRYKNFAEATRLFRGSIDRRGERTAELYLETLNIIGDRLRKLPKVNITLVGSTSNTGGKENEVSLGKARAVSIRDYLVDTWKIDPSRISVVGRILPEKPSPNSLVQGQQENRRVEIISNSDGLTDPIYVTNIEHTANPPKLRVEPSFPDGDSNIDFHISMRIGGVEVQRFDGNTSDGSGLQKDWTITEEALSSKADSLEIVLFANEEHGQSANARTAIKLEQHHTQHEEEQKKDRYSLILFDFDESTLTDKNERIIGIVADALKRIKPRQIIISGYTDELGDSRHNQDLSASRAQKAADHLRSELHRRGVELPSNTIIEGKGSHEHLYDNNFPEGRFLSRTVMITLVR